MRAASLILHVRTLLRDRMVSVRPQTKRGSKTRHQDMWVSLDSSATCSNDFSGSKVDFPDAEGPPVQRNGKDSKKQVLNCSSAAMTSHRSPEPASLSGFVQRFFRLQTLQKGSLLGLVSGILKDSSGQALNLRGSTESIYPFSLQQPPWPCKSFRIFAMASASAPLHFFPSLEKDRDCSRTQRQQLRT